jgi:hypothetical protein
MKWFVSRGWHGWALVAVVVIAFDVGAAVWGGEPMTNAARRWFNDSIGRWLVGALAVFLVAHLTVLPRRIDPLDRAYAALRRHTEKPRLEMPSPEFVREHGGDG